MVWVPRNSLAFPFGTLPGFDPSHVASQGIKFSAVPVAGAFINLGSNFASLMPSVTGTITPTIDGTIGPTKNGATNGYFTYTSGTVLATDNITMAAIIRTSGSDNGSFFANGEIGTTPYCLGNYSGGIFMSPGSGGDVHTNLLINPNSTYFIAVSMPRSNNSTNITVNTVAVNLDNGAITTATNNVVVDDVSASGQSGFTVGYDVKYSSYYPGRIAAVMSTNNYLSMQQLLQWAADPWSFWYPNQDDSVSATPSTIANLSGVQIGTSAGNLGTNLIQINSALATTSAGLFAKAITVPGVQATSAAGIVTPAVLPVITGAQAASAAGSFAKTIAVSLTGALATSAAGLFTPAVTRPLTGAQATSIGGVIVPAIAVALSGAQANSAAGLVSAALAVALTGVQSIAQAGSIVPTLILPLTGAQANSAVGTISATTAKVVALSGAAATSTAGLFGPIVLPLLTGVQLTTTTTGTDITEIILPSLTIMNTAAGSLAIVETIPLSGAQTTGTAGNISTGGSLNLSLPGVQTNSSAGSFGVVEMIALSGAASTSAAGLIARSILPTIPSVSSTSAAGIFGIAITVTLNGAQANSAAGTISPPGITNVALTGVVATSAAGLLAVVITKVLTGTQSTSTAGILGPSAAIALASAQSTSAAGTMGVSISANIAVTGAAAQSAAGILAEIATKALAGTQISTAAGNFAPITSFLNGVQARLSAGVFGIIGPTPLVPPFSVVCQPLVPYTVIVNVHLFGTAIVPIYTAGP